MCLYKNKCNFRKLEVKHKISNLQCIEVDAKTKESTKKTEEKLDGRYKEDHDQKKPK
jgi:hypothetical protein